MTVMVMTMMTNIYWSLTIHQALCSSSLHTALWDKNFIIFHIFGWEDQGLERLKSVPSVTLLTSKMKVLSVKHLNGVSYGLEQFAADLGGSGEEKRLVVGLSDNEMTLTTSVKSRAWRGLTHNGPMECWHFTGRHRRVNYIIPNVWPDLALGFVSSITLCLVSQRTLLTSSLLFRGRAESRTSISWVLAPQAAVVADFVCFSWDVSSARLGSSFQNPFGIIWMRLWF